MTTYYKTGLW